jgi:hypothetical protein
MASLALNHHLHCCPQELHQELEDATMVGRATHRLGELAVMLTIVMMMWFGCGCWLVLPTS